MKRNDTGIHRLPSRARRIAAGLLLLLLFAVCTVPVSAVAVSDIINSAYPETWEVFSETSYDNPERRSEGWNLDRIVVWEMGQVFGDDRDNGRVRNGSLVRSAEFGPEGGTIREYFPWADVSIYQEIQAPGPVVSPDGFTYTVDNYGPNNASRVNVILIAGDYTRGSGAPFDKWGETTSEHREDGWDVSDLKNGIITIEYITYFRGEWKNDDEDLTTVQHHVKVHELSPYIAEFPKSDHLTIVFNNLYMAVEFHYSYEEITQTVISHAQEEAGEDEGTTIWNEIVESQKPSGQDDQDGDWSGIDSSTAEKIAISVGGALATAGALAGASAGGKKDGGEEEEKKRKTYKMKVYKNFGDGIRRGAKPVFVWAQIVEVMGGTEFGRPDLTARISVSGSGLTAAPAGMENDWQGARVSVPAEAEGENGTVIFTFTGEGGTFQNRIVFRIVGDPKITFPDVTEDGAHWDVNERISSVDMIAGLGGRERLRFVITDTAVEPKAIRFKNHDGLSVTAEKDPQWQFTYYACIENRTDPIEKENGIFASEEVIRVTVEAEFEDGLTVEDAFSVRLYPEGLSAAADARDMKDGRLLVNTVPKENVSPGYSPFDPAVFFLTLAVMGDDGKARIRENPSFTDKDITDDGKYGLLFRENFEYSIYHRSSSGIALYPETTLPCTDNPYEARMPISVEDEDGREYEADLPLLLLGDLPKPPSTAEWTEAVERLKKSVRYYGVDNNPQVREIIRHADRHSAAEIENARYHVIAAGVKFYEEYGKAYRRMDDLYTGYIVIGGSLVKAGDYAVTFLLQRGLGKTMGSAAGSIFNPFKNMLFTYLGECLADQEATREELENRFFQTLFESVQDALCDAITGNPKDAPGKVGYAVAAYLMTGFTKHYWGYGAKEAKGDVYKSVIAACGELMLVKFKAWISGLLAKCSEKVMGIIGNWAGSLFRKSFNGAVQKTIEAAGNKAFDAGMRPLVQRGGVTTAEYLAVKASKEVSQKLQEEAVNNFLSYSANEFSKNAAEAANITLGTVLNYVWKGKLEDNSALGLKTEDVIVEFFCDRLGMKVGNVYKALNGYNDISVRLEDDKIKLRIMDYGVEIPMFENIPTFVNMLINFYFGWMEAVWNYAFPSPGSVPDMRDIREDARKMIDRQKELYDNLKPIEYKYYGK